MENSKKQFTQDEAVARFTTRGLVENTCRTKCKVEYVSDPYTRPNGDEIRIANVNLITQYHVDQFRLHASEGDFNKALNNNLTISVRENDIQLAQNEIIEVYIDWITTKQKDENGKPIKGLFITSYKQLPLSKPKNITLADLTTAVEQTDTVISDTEAQPEIKNVFKKTSQVAE